MEDYFYLNEAEKKDIDVLILKLKKRIMEKDHSVTGCNLNVAKVGGLQSPGVKGEAVIAYCDRSTTQNLMSSGFPAGEKTRQNQTPSFEYTYGDVHELSF
jgi:hypothetical protein